MAPDLDSIVGADGVWSKTRTLLSTDKPHYSGLAGWSIQMSNAEGAATEAYAFVNHDSLFAYSDGKGLFGQQLGDGSLNISCYGPYPEDFTKHCGFNAEDLNIAQQSMLKDVDEWDPQLRTPFAGIGVNTAFYDAMELAKHIIAFAKSEEPEELDSYIVPYEQTMFEHAHTAQALTESSK